MEFPGLIFFLSISLLSNPLRHHSMFFIFWVMFPVSSVLKGWFVQKWECCHHLLILMSFKTFMMFFLLCKYFFLKDETLQNWLFDFAGCLFPCYYNEWRLNYRTPKRTWWGKKWDGGKVFRKTFALPRETLRSLANILHSPKKSCFLLKNFCVSCNYNEWRLLWSPKKN